MKIIVVLRCISLEDVLCERCFVVSIHCEIWHKCCYDRRCSIEGWKTQLLSAKWSVSFSHEPHAVAVLCFYAARGEYIRAPQREKHAYITRGGFRSLAMISSG